MRCKIPVRTETVATTRMYGQLEPWFNKTWRPSEIELVR